MSLGQHSFIAILRFPAGRFDTHLLKQQLKTAHQHLLPGKLSFLQKLPLGLIDDAVAGNHIVIGRDPNGAEGLPQGPSLRLVKVQQCFI